MRFALELSLIANIGNMALKQASTRNVRVHNGVAGRFESDVESGLCFRLGL